jgi:hypothetical protein
VNDDTPDLVSREQTAFRLGVSVKTVDRMRARGLLVTKPVLGRMMITVESIDRFLGRGGEPDQPPKRGDSWEGFEIPGLDDLPEDQEEAA